MRDIHGALQLYPAGSSSLPFHSPYSLYTLRGLCVKALKAKNVYVTGYGEGEDSLHFSLRGAAPTEDLFREKVEASLAPLGIPRYNLSVT